MYHDETSAHAIATLENLCAGPALARAGLC